MNMNSVRIRNRRSADGEKAASSHARNGGKSIKVSKADWHIDILLAIESGNWERVRELVRLLGEYQDSVDPAKNQGKKRKPSFWKRLGSQTEKDATGLLTRDREGRTPLHLALSSKDTPKDIAIALVQLEPKAAAISNERERLPLHFAVVHKHHNDVLTELIDAFPTALASTDVNDKSPLAYAMDMAKHRTDVTGAPRTYWMPPEIGSEEEEWQARQGETWGVVHWLLLSSATHPQSSLSVGGKKPMLVDALLHAAPPAVISLLIGASSMLLSFDNRATAFAGSTLYSCITRHYPLAILMSLAAQCPKDVRIVRDETGMGLISALFISGCFEPIKNTGEWKPSPAFFTAFQDSVRKGVLCNDVPGFQDWWRKIEFLIAFCTGDNPEEVSKEHLLHAALSNSDVPPAVIRLLLSLYPKSVLLADPELGVRPVHLASAGREYIPRQYELEMEGNNKSGLEMIAAADTKAISTRHEDRLPLNVAIESGKTLASLEPLIAANEKSLRQRDPKTKLYPFQQVAAYPNRSEQDSVRWSCVARNKYSHAVWKGLSDRQKAAAVYRVVEEDSLNRLETVFALLRRQPLAIKPSKPKAEPINVARDSSGMGMIAAHYMTWCYQKEKGQMKRNETNLKVLQTTIQEASRTGRMGNVSPDFITWWGKMKFWIRYCCPSKLEKDGKPFSSPNSDEFLLHAALINSDTPPQIIELLLSLYSRAASISIPGDTMLPLHLIAQTTCYTARPFEDVHSTSLELTVRAYPRAVRVLVEGRLPLHMAIEAGKTWDELRSLVEEEPRALKVKESATELFPFQLMAIRQTYTPEQRVRFQHIAQNIAIGTHRKRLSAQDVTKEVRRVQKEYQLDVLSSIYKILRRDPSAIRACDDRALVEESLAGAAVPPDENATSLLATGTKESQKDEGGTKLTVDDDNDDDSVGVEQATEQRPSSLMRLLSSDATKGTDTDDVFECDATLFSNVDVMSTLSESFTMASQHSSKRALAAGSLSNHRGMARDWSDEDFGDVEDSFRLEESSPRLNYSEDHDEIPDETSGHMDFAEDSVTVIDEASSALHPSKQEKDIDDADTTESSNESVVIFKLRRIKRGEYWNEPNSDEAVRLRKKPPPSSSLAGPRKSSSQELSGSIHSTCSDSSSSMASFYLSSREKNLLGDLNSSSESRAETNTSSSALESLLEGPTNHKITQKLKGSVDMMWMTDEASADESFAVEEIVPTPKSVLPGSSAQQRDESSSSADESLAVDEIVPMPKSALTVTSAQQRDESSSSADESFAVEEIVPMPKSALTGTSAQERDESSWEPEDSFAIDYAIPPAPSSAILSSKPIHREEIVPTPKSALTVTSAQQSDESSSSADESFAVEEMVPMPKSALTGTSAQERDESSWEPEDSFAIDYVIPPAPPSSILSSKPIQREEISPPESVQNKKESVASDQVGSIYHPPILSQDENVRGRGHSSLADETEAITKTNSDAPGGLSSSSGKDAYPSARSDSEDEDLAMYFDKISMRWKKGKPQPASSEDFYASYRSVQSSSTFTSTQDSEVSSPYQPVKGKLKAPPAKKLSELSNPFVDVLSREEIRKKNRAFSKARHAADASYPEDVLAISEGKGVETTFRSQPIIGETLSPRKMKSSWYAILGRDRKLSCLFCSENNREVLMLPCRHLCICRHCSVKNERIHFCPLCQGEVTDKILIF
jgi:hypothetical protein